MHKYISTLYIYHIYIYTQTYIGIYMYIYILNTRCIRFSILHGMIVFIDLTRILQPHHVLTVNGGGNWERTQNNFFHVCDILKNMHNSLTFSRKIDTCFRCFPQINLNAYWVLPFIFWKKPSYKSGIMTGSIRIDVEHSPRLQETRCAWRWNEVGQHQDTQLNSFVHFFGLP